MKHHAFTQVIGKDDHVWRIDIEIDVTGLLQEMGEEAMHNRNLKAFSHYKKIAVTARKVAD